ncbi:MAG: hypothetical protein IPI52_00585 [Bacteroidetes bacterium]|nr:hypothetical protein [Bacteroidota bacterium]
MLFAQQLYCPVAIDESNGTAHLNYQADLQSMGAQRDLGQAAVCAYNAALHWQLGCWFCRMVTIYSSPFLH